MVMMRRLLIKLTFLLSICAISTVIIVRGLFICVVIETAFVAELLLHDPLNSQLINDNTATPCTVTNYSC